MTSLLIEEEEIALLGKMLYYSASHLTRREREIYDRLIEQLMRKVNQHRQAERMHGSSKPKSPTDSRLLAKKAVLQQMTPEQLCKEFIDTWNKQDFETEYLCLAACFPHRKKKADSLDEYILHRMSKYQERKTFGPIAKRVTEISSTDVRGNKAEVYCFEVHKMPDKDLTLHRLYQLIYENGSWHIADFETLKSHEHAVAH